MMEMESTISFGNFTEDERAVLFSKESVNSSGVEFPEQWGISSSYEYCEQGKTRPLSDVENLKSDGQLFLANEALEGSRPNVNVLRDNGPVLNTSKFAKSIVNDSKSKNIDLSETRERNCVDIYECGESPDLENDKSNLSVQNMSCEHETAVKHTGKDNGLIHNVVENGEIREPDGSPLPSTDMANSVNVVTVGTKTVMTTSTRTVESGHEVTKSSWADLFKTKSSSRPQGPLCQPPTPLGPPKQADHDTPDDPLSKKDQFQQYFLDILKKICLTNQVPSLQPRGLKNNGNWCYINSTLQVLLYSPSFYHFLIKFRLKTDRGTSFTPILDALVWFACQFNEMPPQQSTGKSRDYNKPDVVMGMAFEPTCIYKLLSQVKTTLSQQGKQEDAEEFFSCILNGLHDELVNLGSPDGKLEQESLTSSTQNAGRDQAVGEWEQVGPRNKSTVTRKATMARSPVAAIFGGYLRSSLVQQGMKESASIQPFFTIPLDLRGEVGSVQQAFDNFFRVEEVEGFQCDTSKAEVEVSKKWTLDSLPVVLVLHLKRFVVGKNGCEKLTKKISYESHLQVPTDTLSKTVRIRNKNTLSYKLFAVTYHHGKNLHGGHYTSDIFHPAVGWLRADDMNVRTVPPKFVFNPLSNRDPYLLYYCRGDIAS